MSQDRGETLLVVDTVVAGAGPVVVEPVSVAPATMPERPDGVPEPFWDPEACAVRTDALLEAHRKLEGTLGLLTGGEGGLSDAARDRLLEVLGRPGSPEAYAIALPGGGPIEPDPELNGRLHAAGFTQAQAQLVYELAGERLVPVVAEIAGELEAQRQVDRLQQHFGGAEAWAGVARQVRTWAEGSLEPEAYAALASSHDGVLALHRMMRAAEPELLDGGGGGGGGGGLNEEALGVMVNDPRYWRRRDPAFVARVTEGFRRLYGG